jgi:hypothetical protein
MSNSSDIPVVFNSWKEIASYLGKGVRTVQRWEVQFGLPVQRPNIKNKGVVRASREELDHWVATRWSQRPSVSSLDDTLNELRRTVAELASQNANLRRQLDEKNRGNGSAAGSSAANHGEIKLLLQHCDQLLKRTELMQQKFAETLDSTKTQRELRSSARRKTNLFGFHRSIH